MIVARRVAMTASVIGWLYGWFLLRGVRNEYAAGDLGAAPAGLFLLLFVVTFVTIGTTVVAGLRLRAWPIAAVVAGVLLVVGIIAAQYFPLRSYAEQRGTDPAAIGVADAVRVGLRSRSPAGVIVATGVPMLLLLSGLSGLMLGRIPPRTPIRRTGDGPPAA